MTVQAYLDCGCAILDGGKRLRCDVQCDCSNCEEEAHWMSIAGRPSKENAVNIMNPGGKAK